ncbi:MAG TPA: glutamine-hydrolyzing GMP synthase, partial [Chloroflexota bacterium]|nr:glutamine-hydrolyzing GMP synthase [Chloroflexota bacterium]
MAVTITRRRAIGFDGGGQLILVLDFGSQYSRLIARRIREQRVYCEVLPHDAAWSEIQSRTPKGIVLSGGPASAYDEDAPRCVPEVFTSDIPVLGICYGLQLMALELGGATEPASHREYGPANISITQTSGLFAGLPDELAVWMSHADRVTQLPDGFFSIAESTNSPYAAITDGHLLTAIQFHPEVKHTPRGGDILRNFAVGMCQDDPSWTPGNFIAESIVAIRKQVGRDRVICALSGGVDSAVAAVLLATAIGDQLTCVFVDTGLLRSREAEELTETFTTIIPSQTIRVDASDRFLAKLAGVVDPEDKRHAIGHEFIEVFSDEARKLGEIRFLAQGTLYPDVIESTSHDTHGAAKIKTHHNVGGLPPDLKFELVEPLRYLFKDEVRAVGRELGLPEVIVGRQPFPGPGLAVRIIGEVTATRLEVLRAADQIVDQEVRSGGWYDRVWQSFAVLTPVQTVGVMGDGRTYSNVIGIRAVTSEDAMTADWARLPYEILGTISNRIVNE